MSSVAKVFVVLNLILAVMTFGAAATLLGAQDDYKAAVEKTSAEFADYKKARDDEWSKNQEQIRTQTNLASSASARAQDAEAREATLRTDLTNAQRVNQSQLSTNDSLAKEVAAANKIIADNKEWMERTAAEAKKCTDDATKARKALDDEINNRVQLEQQIANLNERVEQMAAEKGDVDKKLREVMFERDEYARRHGPLTPSPGAEGSVLNVRAADDGSGASLVQISVGSKDGVRSGDEYHLSRGGVYVGWIQITDVEKDSAVGVFNAQYPGAGAPPRKGDRAYVSK
jgi:hypothetical protein